MNRPQLLPQILTATSIRAIYDNKQATCKSPTIKAPSSTKSRTLETIIVVYPESVANLSAFADRKSNTPINRNHGKSPRIPRPCRKGQVSDTKGTIIVYVLEWNANKMGLRWFGIDVANRRILHEEGGGNQSRHTN